MGKLLATLIVIISTSTCLSDNETYCWECESEQAGDYWSEVFHEWTEDEIDGLIIDDYNEYTPIYTTCYKLSCSRH